GYYLGAKPFVVVTDPELLKLIQVKDFQHFTQRPYVIPGGIYHNWKYHEMVTRVDSLRWKKMRTLLSPWFSSMHLKTNTPIINMCVEDMIERMDKLAQNDEEFNIYERLEATTIDIIDRTGFSITTDIQDKLSANNPFFQATRGVFNIRPNRQFLASLLLCFPELSPIINLIRDVSETLWDYFGYTSHGLLWRAGEAIVKNRLDIMNGKSKGVDKNNNKLKAYETKRKDLLELMIEVRNNSNKNTEKTLNDVEIIANTVVLHEAAYESPANLLGFAIHNLVNYPDIQQKCCEEINSLYEKDNKFDFNVMSDMPVLDAVISETFRLYPTDTIFTSRMSKTDYKYKDIVIPKGVDIRVPTVQLHRDPEYWSEPNRFDPNRFMDKKTVIDPVMYQPFGVGPRICPGKRFGLLEIKLILAHILHNYNIIAGQKTESGELELDFKLITCSPKNGVLVLCDHTDDQWNWVNKLPQSPPGNWPQLAGHISSRPISAPNPIPGPLGLFFVDSYPLPDVTVITEVNLTYFDHLKCTKESVIKELLFNTSLLLPLQCNGKQAIIESIYDLQFREHAAPGPQHELNVPQFYAYTTALNGNILKVGSGIITEPPKCAGGYLWRLVVLVANNQYGCVSRTGEAKSETWFPEPPPSGVTIPPPGPTVAQCNNAIYRRCNQPRTASAADLATVLSYLNTTFTTLADVKPDSTVALCSAITVRQDWRCLSPAQRTAVIAVWQQLYTNGVVANLTDIYVRYWQAWHASGEIIPAHRWLAYELESYMQQIDPTVSLPYWCPWIVGAHPERSIIWDTFGHNGSYSGGILFYMKSLCETEVRGQRWQLARQENLTPLSYNIINNRFNPDSGEIETASIATDNLTGAPDVSIRSLWWLGFGTLCSVPDNLIKPIVRVTKGQADPLPRAISRMQAWIIAKYYSGYLNGNTSAFLNTFDEVGDCNQQCLPLPKPTFLPETAAGRAILAMNDVNRGAILSIAEQRYYDLWFDLSKSGYCSPYVTP
ncbi:unnamed protein product, partial [Oppiella nova]